jgi:hypothetical protein
MNKVIRRIRATLQHRTHRAFIRVTAFSHLAYYGLVSVEAHGHYRYAAGVLGVLLIVEAFTGSADNEP